MLELRLLSGTVVAFDGRVIEVFDDASSTRLHVSHLNEATLTRADDGEVVRLAPTSVELRFSRSEASAARRLLAALDEARASEARLSLPA